MHTARDNDMSGTMAILGLFNFIKFIVFMFFLVIWGLPWGLDLTRIIVSAING